MVRCGILLYFQQKFFLMLTFEFQIYFNIITVFLKKKQIGSNRNQF